MPNFYELLEALSAEHERVLQEFRDQLAAASPLPNGQPQRCTSEGRSAAPLPHCIPEGGPGHTCQKEKSQSCPEIQGASPADKEAARRAACELLGPAAASTRLPEQAEEPSEVLSDERAEGGACPEGGASSSSDESEDILPKHLDRRGPGRVLLVPHGGNNVRVEAGDDDKSDSSSKSGDGPSHLRGHSGQEDGGSLVPIFPSAKQSSGTPTKSQSSRPMGGALALSHSSRTSVNNASFSPRSLPGSSRNSIACSMNVSNSMRLDFAGFASRRASQASCHSFSPSRANSILADEGPLATSRSLRRTTSSMSRLPGTFIIRPQWELDDDCCNEDSNFLFSVNEEPSGGRSSRNSKFRASAAVPSVETFHFAPPAACLRALDVFHPQSTVRFAADLLALAFMLQDVVMIPVTISFAMPQSIAFQVIDWMTAIFWTVDVLFSLNSGFYSSDGSLVMRRRAIALRYAKTWLCLDAVVLIPEWTLLLSGGGDGLLSFLGALRSVRVLRMLRLLRLVKLDRILRHMQERINSNYFLLSVGVARLIGCLAIVIHFLACFWYGLGESQEDGWVNVRRIGGESFWFWYFTSVHWSLTQFHGSTDVNPTNTVERAFAVLVVMLALIVFSSFLSSITHMMMQISSLRQEQTSRMRTLLGYLDDNQISLELSVRVKKYVEGASTQRQNEQKVELLKLLPQQMLMDLHDEARAPVLNEHHFLSQYRASNPRAVRQMCHEALQQLTFQNEESIFAVGDACDRMVFVEWGSVKYTPTAWAQPGCASATKHFTDSTCAEALRGSQQISLESSEESRPAEPVDLSPKDLNKGQWLSEATLWTRWVHRGDLVARTTTATVLALDAMTFATVTHLYDVSLTECVLYARAFVEALNLCRNPTDLLHFNVKRLNARASEGDMADGEDQGSSVLLD